MNRLIAFAGVFIISITGFSQKKERSKSWTSIVQSIGVNLTKERKFKLKGYVKVVSEDTLAWAGLWFRVDTKDGEIGSFGNMSQNRITHPNWKEYSIEGVLNQESDVLNFGSLCIHEGFFYFDNIQLFIENDEGIMDRMDVVNSGFEKTVEKEEIPEWIEGISMASPSQAKEYVISSTEDKVEGRYALLISGKKTHNVVNEYEISEQDGFSPHVGTLLDMLESLKNRVHFAVQNLDLHETDYLLDEKANRIGSLIMHLAAAEAFYQVRTFEGRGFNKEEKKKWGVALDLDQKGRDEFKGKDISFYLTEYTKVRERTIELLKTKDDVWLYEETPGYGMNNYYAWFHVMEHQSSHLGQILFLKKRIPPKGEIQINEEIKQ